jgi:small subunit ribosomal protein S7e
MFTGRKKILKAGGAEPDDFEKRVAQEIFNLEARGRGRGACRRVSRGGGAQVSDNATLKALSKLYITAAKQVDVDDGKKAIIVFVPPPLLKEFRAIHKTLVEELEKKFRWARAVDG